MSKKRRNQFSIPQTDRFVDFEGELYTVLNSEIPINCPIDQKSRYFALRMSIIFSILLYYMNGHWLHLASYFVNGYVICWSGSFLLFWYFRLINKYNNDNKV